MTKEQVKAIIHDMTEQCLEFKSDTNSKSCKRVYNFNEEPNKSILVLHNAICRAIDEAED